MRFDTLVVHSGQAPPETGDVVPPLHLSTAYDRRAQTGTPAYYYGRGENPTREGLERCLADLEDAPFAAAFTSGQAAAAAVLAQLPPGRRLVCGTDVYSGTRALLAALPPVGRRPATVFADLHDPAAAAAALSADDIGMVWIETPGNPMLRITDIAALHRSVAGRGVLVVVDNTFAGPVLQQPLRLGADVSLYSTTKSTGGHGDVIGGALVYRDAAVDARLRAHRTTAGTAAAPFDCFLVRRGVHTLPLRVRRQVRTARALVELLCDHPRVTAVHYPGLPEHPGHAVAARQMTEPGPIVSFEIRGDPAEVLDRVRILTPAVSLGGVRSLIECPALMTHAGLTAAERAEAGLPLGLLRISAGLEDPLDLAEDLTAALR